MISDKKFQKTMEDFLCAHCGASVHGSGYTNHCPNCLWSKHVDVNPGDRNEKCGGLMRPVGFEKRGGRYFIMERCERCGFERNNAFNRGDNFDVLLALSPDL